MAYDYLFETGVETVVGGYRYAGTHTPSHFVLRIASGGDHMGNTDRKHRFSAW